MALVVLMVMQQPTQRASLMSGSPLRGINQRIQLDEMKLGRDMEKRNRIMQTLTRYPDGCDCSPRNCLTPQCDEEYSDGPLCKCPGEKTKSMPDAATPWKMRATSAPVLRQMNGAAPVRSMVGINTAVLPPYTGALAMGGAGRARTQQKWVGAPQKFLPPNGDYPGGSTGLPEDGYVAFETGWSGDGPYHGLVLPMQDTGMMSEPDAVKSDKAVAPQSLHMQKPPSSDEYVPARKVPSNYFQGSMAYGPTVNAVSSLFQ